MKWHSTAKRPVHLGPLPLEQLRRLATAPNLSALVPDTPLDFASSTDRLSLIPAMDDYMAMLDAVRVGLKNPPAVCPEDGEERARHLKAFGYFNDASLMAVCAFDPAMDRLIPPFRNPGIDRLAHRLQTEQTKTLAAGIDVIMADLKASMEVKAPKIDRHTHALVILYAHPRPPRSDEPGTAWIQNAQAQRSALRANECACVLTNYLRALGYDALAHSQSTSEVALARLAVKAGAAIERDGAAICPLLPLGYGIAVVTTDFALAPDRPLDPDQRFPRVPPAFAKRDYLLSEHAFETLTRVDRPTTLIDDAKVPRVPKRTDMFARALFGDLGPKVQEAAKNGAYVSQAPTSFAQRRALGAFVLIQNGDPDGDARPSDPQTNAENIKGAAYWLGADAVGLSSCPDWAYYSHNARGEPIDPYHDQAISLIVDQGFETMEGASGDDWISCAQSMRAYLRFSLIGGVIARQIRRLGYSARAHTVLDGEVLQPPLLLLAGLGEVSRIGEVILNPFLGPRLKSGVVTTDMPLAHDRPIDFGLQKFCARCNKCARECPSGAITAGPKVMFNGYEIWKSDSQRCTTYRLTTPGGAMCGRCMKTCPWNMEGLMVEGPFRWMAMNVPQAAPWLAWMDDALGRGGLNPVKKWWWDLEMQADRSYAPAKDPVNARDLQRDLRLKTEDQTLAAYPAPLAPPPWPYPYPMDREAAIAAYKALASPEDYRAALAAGRVEGPRHEPLDHQDAPVLQVVVTRIELLSPGVRLIRFEDPSGNDVPAWGAGAHIDVVVAPEFLRPYSLCSNPADRKGYEVAVLEEPEGRGGSALLHKIFAVGRRVFISKPINHFPLAESRGKHWLFGGGIGVTPLIAMAHELHARGADFALHYSVPTRPRLSFGEPLRQTPWHPRLVEHISDAGSRADLDDLLASAGPNDQIYTCGPDAYMTAVQTAALAAGVPQDQVHQEYFAVPETPEHENHPFTLVTPQGRAIEVTADQSAAEALQAAGVKIDIKCADGLCGVCKWAYTKGELDHRDYVLSQTQRATHFIACQSRAKKAGDVIRLGEAP